MTHLVSANMQEIASIFCHCSCNVCNFRLFGYLDNTFTTPFNGIESNCIILVLLIFFILTILVIFNCWNSYYLRANAELIFSFMMLIK